MSRNFIYVIRSGEVSSMSEGEPEVEPGKLSTAEALKKAREEAEVVGGTSQDLLGHRGEVESSRKSAKSGEEVESGVVAKEAVEGEPSQFSFREELERDSEKKNEMKKGEKLIDAVVNRELEENPKKKAGLEKAIKDGNFDAGHPLVEELSAKVKSDPKVKSWWEESGLEAWSEGLLSRAGAGAGLGAFLGVYVSPGREGEWFASGTRSQWILNGAIAGGIVGAIGPEVFRSVGRGVRSFEGGLWDVADGLGAIMDSPWKAFEGFDLSDPEGSWQRFSEYRKTGLTAEERARGEKPLTALEENVSLGGGVKLLAFLWANLMLVRAVQWGKGKLDKRKQAKETVESADKVNTGKFAKLKEKLDKGKGSVSSRFNEAISVFKSENLVTPEGVSELKKISNKKEFLNKLKAKNDFWGTSIAGSMREVIYELGKNVINDVREKRFFEVKSGMDKLKGKLGELDIGKPSAVWGGKKVKTVGKKVAKPVYGGEKLPNPYKFTYIKGANKEDISISGLRPTRVRLFGKAKKMVGGLEGKKITIAVYEEKSEWKLKIIDCAPGMKVKKGNKFNLDAVEETA